MSDYIKRMLRFHAHPKMWPPDDDQGGWLVGPVACWYCGHEWVSVRPASCETGLECPTCGLLTGYADDGEDDGPPTLA